MPFTFTNGRGVAETVDVNPHAMMDAHLTGVTWVGMRQEFGIVCSARRVREIRMSPEWEASVREFARVNNRYPEPLVNRFCVQPRGEDSASSDSAAGVVVPSIVNAPANFPQRQFGVELEVVSKLDRLELRDILRAAGVNVYRGYYDSGGADWWKLGTDVSIRCTPQQRRNGYVETMEIVSPPLSGADGLREAERVLNLLHPHVSANKTCGQHVHVDLAGVTVDELRRLSAAWLKHEWVVNSLIPPSRRYRANRFCWDNGRQLDSYDGAAFGEQQREEIERVSRLRSIRRVREEMEDGLSKYRKFNLTAMLRHGTVEFRHWSGTGAPEKVIRNIQFSVGFVSEFLDSDMVSADAERPSDWDATSTLMSRLARWVGDAGFPYYWIGRQMALGSA